ncbi:MAG: hypothetical protein HQL49_11005, partial [Gammaproteobacteria bacterium]|nr:hypothetical protein [Gammaproteobacteria bacterium]
QTIIEDSRLISYFYVADSPLHGQGLFARHPLKGGEYLGSYHGLLR